MEANRHAYYLERARVSKRLADEARNPEIAAIHLDFYNRYLRRAEDESQRHPRIRLVQSQSPLGGPDN